MASLESYLKDNRITTREFAKSARTTVMTIWRIKKKGHKTSKKKLAIRIHKATQGSVPFDEIYTPYLK